MCIATYLNCFLCLADKVVVSTLIYIFVFLLVFLLQVELPDAYKVSPLNITDSGNHHDNSEEVTVQVHAPQDPLISDDITHKSGDSQIRV